MTRPPLNDTRVRKALALAADKKRIVDKILRAGQIPAATLVPPSMPRYRPPEGLGYDPAEVTGYAFGMGIERIAMILYGIEDIRHIYENDIRFLRQF